MAADLVIPSTITDGGANTAATVMTDLNAIVTWLNTNALHIDGTKALTGRLSSPNTDPSAGDDYARKAYGDAKSTTENAAMTAADNLPPKVGCSVSGTTSVPNSSLTALSFSSETYDSDGFFAPTSTNIVIPTGFTGLYIVKVSLTSNPGATVNTAIYLNGAEYRNPFPSTFTSTTGGVGYSMALFTQGDIVTFRVTQFSGSSLNMTSSVELRRVSA